MKNINSYVIIYFSGTGNTKLIAHQIKLSLEQADKDVQLISIEDKEAIENLELKNKIIGFGYPVYKFSYPDIFQEIIEKINKKAIENEYFVFSSFARFNAYALDDFCRQFDENKLKLIAKGCFKAPSCGIAARKDPEIYEYKSVMFFEDNITKVIDDYVKAVLEKRDIGYKVKKVSLKERIQKNIVKDIEIVKYPKLSIDKEKCIACGLCLKNCPDNNYYKVENGIEIKDDKGCLHCLRCMHNCPKNAIDFGYLTKGDNRYTYAIRDKMFEKSASGYKEKYWADFEKIIKLWRKQTLKYWLTQKFKIKK